MKKIILINAIIDINIFITKGPCIPDKEILECFTCQKAKSDAECLLKGSFQKCSETDVNMLIIYTIHICRHTPSWK